MALGEKRGNSIFKNTAQPQPQAVDEPIIETVENEIVVPETTMEQRVADVQTDPKDLAQPVELGVKKSSHSLFFAPKSDGRDFASVLKDVQEYISENYSQLITDSTLDDSKEQMKRYISKFVMEKRIAVTNMNGEELISALYTEMAEYGFLTKYIFGKGIEEIDSATRS